MESPLVILTDGGSRGNPGDSAAAIYLPAENTASGRFLGVCTNNEAEYHGLLLALKEAHQRRVKSLKVYMDSKLVVNQIKGLYRVSSESLLVLWCEAKAQISRLEEFEIFHIYRENNTHADAEVNRILDEVQHWQSTPSYGHLR